jgi:hypothetical protein
MRVKNISRHLNIHAIIRNIRCIALITIMVVLEGPKYQNIHKWNQ